MSAMLELTRNDDRLLARLQTIISDILLASESNGDDLIILASEYAETLAHLEEQTIKTRLDRTFLKYVANADTEEMEGLPYLDAQEFNDLIVEVADVANMRAKEGLLQPILQYLSSDNESKTGNIAQRCAYISNTLALLDARNKEAEVEISNRNNMQSVSGRMQTLFDLSLRDFHDAMQSTARSAASLAKLSTPAVQPQPTDEKMAYIENKLWRSMGIPSLAPREGLAGEITGRTAKLQSKEDLYKQLWATNLKYIQEGKGVVNGLEDSVGGREGGGAVAHILDGVEDKVKSISAEVGQLASVANARDIPKMTVMNYLQKKEMYGR
ncbi:hypothetical protein ABW20_dc0103475 [Dactylellina cionopaga]|nr:hypothetical protein ABW20_dc0103475 [Dactylellina cionopaga]